MHSPAGRSTGALACRGAEALQKSGAGGASPGLLGACIGSRRAVAPALLFFFNFLGALLRTGRSAAAQALVLFLGPLCCNRLHAEVQNGGRRGTFVQEARKLQSIRVLGGAPAGTGPVRATASKPPTRCPSVALDAAGPRFGCIGLHWPALQRTREHERRSTLPPPRPARIASPAAPRRRVPAKAFGTARARVRALWTASCAPRI
mgnify:CR=1 FL=1